MQMRDTRAISPGRWRQAPQAFKCTCTQHAEQRAPAISIVCGQLSVSKDSLLLSSTQRAEMTTPAKGGTNCCVPGCSNHGDGHRWPKDKEMSRKWFVAVRWLAASIPLRTRDNDGTSWCTKHIFDLKITRLIDITVSWNCVCWLWK